MSGSIETLRFTRESAPGFFPPPLWEVKRPPTEIYIRGRSDAFQLLEKLPERGLAIVGSRRCQPRSVQIIREVLSPMRGFDWIIISGLAKGVDAAAHEWALRLGFPTIAILGCGLDIQYPADHRDLRKRILDAGGLIVSELDLEHEPLPWAFIHRNRLIAGWSRATWVVQAGYRSGALNTASWAIQHERALFATPSFPGDPNLVGNQRLLTERNAKCAWNARSFGEIWLELESFLSERQTELQLAQCSMSSAPLPTLERVLLNEVVRRTSEHGGVVFTELLGWALEIGWTPEMFFNLAEKLSKAGRLIRTDPGVLRSEGPTAFPDRRTK